MKTLIATLLATAAGATFAAAPTFGLNHDVATYRNLTQKAGAAYTAAVAKCEGMKSNDQDVCMAEARLSRTRAEAEALSRYNTSPTSQTKVRTELANAEYNLAKARCEGKTGADKDDCLNNAKSVHMAALADAKSGRPATESGANASGQSTSGAIAAGAGTGLITTTDTRDPAKAAAVDKCAQAGDAQTGCLVQTKPTPVRDNAADTAAAATATAADKTKSVASKAAEKTKEVAHAVVEKTKEVASAVAQKTGPALERTGDKTADKTTDVAAKTRAVAADTAITTKVKAGLVKEPDLESLGIHVETEKGVVMLSGFVNSKTAADKAVSVARNVDGVSSVKSAIQVK
jgi:hyperosmotically inducible protein